MVSSMGGPTRATGASSPRVPPSSKETSQRTREWGRWVDWCPAQRAGRRSRSSTAEDLKGHQKIRSPCNPTIPLHSWPLPPGSLHVSKYHGEPPRKCVLVRTLALAQNTPEITVGCILKTTLKITVGDSIPSVNPNTEHHDNKARVREDGDKRAR